MNLFRGELVESQFALLFFSAGETRGAGGREIPVTRGFFEGPGLGQLLTCAGVTMLACIGYGAFFLFIGLFFRNPIIPALVLYGWELINFLLPPLLKKISVIHYLNSLVLIPVNEGPFAVVAEPTPAWIALPGLVIVTVLVLAAAAYRIRRLEIKYGSD